MTRPPLTTSRRKLLSAGTAALCTATAGCVSSLPPLGSQIELGRVDVPEPPFEPRYRKWIPSTTEFPTDHYDGMATAVAPDAFADPSTPASSIGYDIVKSAIDYFGIGFESYSLAVRVGNAVVLGGSFDSQTVRTALQPTGYEAAGTYRDYALYDRPDGNRTVAVRDGTLLFQSGGDGRAPLEYLADLEAGGHAPRVETSASFDAFTRRLGLSPSVLFGFGVGGKSIDATHSALSFRFDSESVYWEFLQYYPDGAEIPRKRLREAARSFARRSAEEKLLVEVETDGRFATLEMRLAREKTDTEGSRSLPQITWGWSVDGGTVTITHEAGESVPAKYLHIGDGPEGTRSRFREKFETVGPGDSVTLPTGSASDSLRIVFETDDSVLVLASIPPEESQ